MLSATGGRLWHPAVTVENWWRPCGQPAGAQHAAVWHQDRSKVGLRAPL